MKTIHPGHLEHRFCIFGCQILCIPFLAIMPQVSTILLRQPEIVFVYLFYPSVQKCRGWGGEGVRMGIVQE